MKQCFILEDLKKELGYKTRKPPRIGNLGYAILQASKKNPKAKWLKNQLDSYFDNLRKSKKVAK